MTHFATKLAQGDLFSNHLKQWFTDHGFYVIPLDQTLPAARYKGPAALNGWQSVLPDLLLCKNGIQIAVEAKWKTEVTHTIKTNTDDVGIEHIDDYRRFAKDSGIPTYILVRVKNQDLWMLGNVNDIRERPALGASSSTRFVPIEQDTWNMDPSHIMAHLNRVAAVRSNQRRRRSA